MFSASIHPLRQIGEKNPIRPSALAVRCLKERETKTAASRQCGL
jgi:hypothetical protein